MSTFNEVAPVFSDGFESGSFGSWTNVGGSFTIATSPVFSGSKSAHYYMSGTTGYDIADVQLASTPNPAYMRAYVYFPNTNFIANSGDWVGVLGYEVCNDCTTAMAIVYNNGGTLVWGIRYDDDNCGFCYYYSNVPVAAGWNSVELEDYNAAGTGEERLFINGVDVFDLTGLYNDVRTAQFARIGGASSLTAATTIDITYDNVVVSSSYIGPLPVTHYVPITLSNAQSYATPGPFQQMLVINSNNYETYINSDWSNVEFTTGPGGTGNPVQAWIETNASNTATHTIVWVNLSSAIWAYGQDKIYLDFMPSNNKVISPAGPTGEAPTLSASYGQYDNGGKVFEFYDNFAGTSLNPSNWTDWGGSEVVDNERRSAPMGRHGRVLSTPEQARQYLTL